MANETIRDVMTNDPVKLPSATTIDEAARKMRDEDIGDVLVLEGDQLCGVVTDRDIVVRAVADRLDPRSTPIDKVCTHGVVTVEAGAPVHEALQLMSEHKVRRLPVVENGHPVGIVTIGDLAIEEDRRSLLADISAAPANN